MGGGGIGARKSETGNETREGGCVMCGDEGDGGTGGVGKRGAEEGESGDGEVDRKYCGKVGT